MRDHPQLLICATGEHLWVLVDGSSGSVLSSALAHNAAWAEALLICSDSLTSI
jgi:hypothetical protein